MTTKLVKKSKDCFKSAVKVTDITDAIKCRESYQLLKKRVFDGTSFIEVTHEKKVKLLIAKSRIVTVREGDK